MAFGDPGHVASILDEVLDYGATALATGGRPIGRVLRSPGIPAYDCEEIVAWPTMRITGQGVNSANRPIQKQLKYALDINIVLLRCITALAVNGLPSPEVVDADGEGFAKDMWILQRAYGLGIAQGVLFPSCTDALMQAFQPATPSGGLSAMSTIISVTLG